MEVFNDGGGFGGFIVDGFCGVIDNFFFGSIGSFIFCGKFFGGKDIILIGGFGGLIGRIFLGGNDIFFFGFFGGFCGVIDMIFGGCFIDVFLGRLSGWNDDVLICGFVCFFLGCFCGNWSGMIEEFDGNLYGSSGCSNFVFGFGVLFEFVLGLIFGGSLGLSMDKLGSSVVDCLVRLCFMFFN